MQKSDKSISALSLQSTFSNAFATSILSPFSFLSYFMELSKLDINFKPFYVIFQLLLCLALKTPSDFSLKLAILISCRSSSTSKFENVFSQKLYIKILFFILKSILSSQHNVLLIRANSFWMWFTTSIKETITFFFDIFLFYWTVSVSKCSSSLENFLSELQTKFFGSLKCFSPMRDFMSFQSAPFSRYVQKIILIASSLSKFQCQNCFVLAQEWKSGFQMQNYDAQDRLYKEI